MKSLYDKDHYYTDQAETYVSLVDHNLSSLFRQWVNLGYSPRELSHLAHSVITELELESMITYYKDL